MVDEALIIFIKNPVKGLVKTRLAKDIGEEQALAVYHKLLHHTREVALQVHAARYLFYADDSNYNDEWLASYFTKYCQQGDNLGSKMHHAFETVFGAGHSKAIIIGADCPSVTASHLNDACRQLDDYDVVIGPATDGGYYLLGMSALYPALFEQKSWSKPVLLEETKATCGNLGLSYYLLPTLTDIDDKDDLEREKPGWLR
ncbi:MAG: glycosyltransferase [Bacteroidetes bacterium SW_11_45_7]|nr:MAG: glycosyltransferase [Bacteroidetes bacterium SW_11_45_7]